MDPATDMGPLIDKADVTRVDALVQAALAYAKPVVRGGPATDGALAAGIFTSSLNTSRRVSREIHAGTIWTNTWAAINDGFAEGGYKQSGTGRPRWPSPTSRKPRPSSTPSPRSRANPDAASLR